MVRPNTLKQRLKKGDIALGPWCVVPSPALSNIISAAGLDFMIVDMEHGPHSYETAAEMVKSAQVENCSALIRVPGNSEDMILRALDIGSDGVMVPHVESVADAEKAIACSKYTPEGMRGFSPFTRAGGYSLENVASHASVQNQRTILGLILEGKNGIEALDQILAIKDIEKNIDLIYIGAYDLSQAMGMPGRVDDPAVKDALISCISRIRAKGIAAGGYVAKNSQDIEWMVKAGMQFITILPDCTVIFHAFEKYAKDLKEISA